MMVSAISPKKFTSALLNPCLGLSSMTDTVPMLKPDLVVMGIAA
jgi:hypothetical protein